MTDLLLIYAFGIGGFLAVLLLAWAVDFFLRIGKLWEYPE